MNFEEGFKNPGKEYRSVPFWLWDGELKPEEIVAQVREMSEKGIGGFFMQAGLGLLTPYLSKEWMDAVKAAVQEAKRIGMDAWLYDENRWPSGFAGGIVPAKDPRYRQKYLVCREIPEGTAFEKDENTVKMFAARKEGERIIDLEDITEKEVELDKLNGKTIIQFQKVFSPTLSWFNNNAYVDTLDTETTDAFIESTYEAYYKEVGNEFGETIPGIFTDEPNYLVPAAFFGQKVAAAVPWTESFPQFFKKKHKYNIVENLQSIFYDIGNYRKVRYDFWSSVTDLFVEVYSKKLYDWCSEHNLKYTGHYLLEDTCLSQIQRIGAVMPHYEYMHIPGVDKLFRNIEEIVTVKQVASVAHQLGKERILCETFAGSGWNLSFEDRKWIANWAYVLGINLMTQCLMRYTMKGVRKRFYPPTLHQQPWWKYYRILADYYARLSYILTQGKFITNILVIHPIGSVWSVYRPLKLAFKARPTDEIQEEPDRSFFSLSRMLSELHRDYDYGDEKLMEKHARVEAGELLIGQMSYRIVVIPVCSTLRESTLDLLERFVSTGGKVIAAEPAPNLVDNKESGRLRALLTAKGVRMVFQNKEMLKETLDELLDPDVQVIDKEGMEIKSIYYQHREIGKKQVYFFTNNDREETFDATVKLKAVGSVEEWNPETGEIAEIPCEPENGYTTIETVFPPAGARLIVLDRTKSPRKEMKKVAEKTESIIEFSETWSYRRTDPNVLLLDYCQHKIENEEWSDDIPVWKVQQIAEQTEKEMGVCMRFSFTARFAVEKRRSIYLVMESPELYSMKMNGRKIMYRDIGWWIDKSFKKVDISKQLCDGENIIELSIPFKKPKLPNTLTYLKSGVELENCYIIGDFAVVQEENGRFCLTDEKPTIATGDLVEQGYPFYAGSITYVGEVNFRKGDRRIFIEFEDIDAVTAKVKVNSVEAGLIAWRPYRIDISTLIKEGYNRIEIELTTSLRNLLGPHHLKGGEKESEQLVGRESFTDEANWISSYNFVKFGLGGKVRLATRQDSL